MNIRSAFAKLCALVAVSVIGVTSAPADIVFDFTGGNASAHFADLDDLGSGTTSSSIITGTFTAQSTSGTPELNFHSSDGIGVNIAGDGGDESNKLDAGVGIESIDSVFNIDIRLTEVHIDGMGWDSSVEYEYADIYLDNVYVATLLDTDADVATQANHVNPVVGGSSDTFVGLNYDVAAGSVLTIEYGEVGGGNGWRIENFAAVPEPTSCLVLCALGVIGLIRRR